MNNKVVGMAESLFHRKYEQLGRLEKRVVHHFAARTQIARNVDKDYSEQLTVGQRLADSVAGFGGSWTFITIFMVFLAGWILLNSVILISYNDSFDPYPYILLNLFLSMLAAIQAPIIMMSQNRKAFKDRLTAEHDYEVNLKAELEIMALHEKMDLLREKQWNELISIQQEQLNILRRLVENSEK